MPSVAVVSVIATSQAPITEGDDAVFTVTRTGGTGSSLTVNLDIDESGDMIRDDIANQPPTSVAIPIGSSSEIVTIRTDDDDENEADSTIEVELSVGSGYTVSSTEGDASVMVADNDLPTVSIAALSSLSVVEGGAALFWVSRNGETTDSLTVSVSVATLGQVISGTAPTSVTIPAGSERSLLWILTDDDDLDEANGTITIALVAGNEYTVSSTAGESSASISVTDNDNPSVSIALNTNQVPVEGDPVLFTLSRVGDLAPELNVTVSVSETGDMYEGMKDPNGIAMLSAMFLSGSPTAPLAVPTQDDDQDEDDSDLTATVTADPSDGYMVHMDPLKAKASVTVSDNDDAVVTTVTLTMRIAAQRLSSGRVEVALQQRGDDDTWGDRILPTLRFIPANGELNKWLYSSGVEVSASATTHSAAVRVAARHVANGRVEVGLQQQTDGGEWGETKLPITRFVPAGSENEWSTSSAVSVEARLASSGARQAAPDSSKDGPLMEAGPVPSETDSRDDGIERPMESEN